MCGRVAGMVGAVRDGQSFGTHTTVSVGEARVSHPGRMGV